MQHEPNNQPDPSTPVSGWWFKYDVYVTVDAGEELAGTFISVRTAMPLEEVWKRATEAAKGRKVARIIKHVIISHELQPPI